MNKRDVDRYSKLHKKVEIEKMLCWPLIIKINSKRYELNANLIVRIKAKRYELNANLRVRI